MCIYLKERENLHYDSAEHIIPKGLGGIKTLPKEYVSREFNNGISKLEQELMRDSFISVSRHFIGPGKRGSLEDRHATKSKIQVITRQDDETNCSIGYSQKTKTIEIPQVKLNVKNGMITFSLDTRVVENSDLIFNEFKTACSSPEALKIKKIISDLVDENTIILGIQKDVEENFNTFFLKNKDNPFELTFEKIKAIGNAIRNDNPTRQQYQQIVQDSFCLDLNHLRVFGKAAFNFLAFSKGLPFVLANKFDTVRNWIAFGGEPMMGRYDFTTLNPIKRINLPFPEDAHFIYIAKADNHLVANVLLSNLNANIVLSDSFNDPFQPIAFFCDWKNHNEYDLKDYLLKIHSKDLE